MIRQIKLFKKQKLYFLIDLQAYYPYRTLSNEYKYKKSDNFLLQKQIKTFTNMNIDSKSFQSQEPTKCTSCQTFFGSETTKGLCSSCFKKSNIENKQVLSDSLRKQSVDTQAEIVPKVEEKKQQRKQQPAKAEQAPVQTDKKRCFNCKKKVGLLGVECKCGFVYCNTHRLPEQHSCSFNHKKVANDRLKEALVKVYNGKIIEI